MEDLAQLEYRCELNKHYWEIQFVSHSKLLEIVNDSEVVQAYGYCQYPFHVVYINMDLCDEEIKNALRHELMHAYLWSIGLCEHEEFSEEDVCNLYSAANDIIEPIVKEVMNCED